MKLAAMKTPAEQMNEMARNIVGDGGEANVYFVTLDGQTMLISVDFQAAYDYWRRLPNNIESTLEDRLNGVVCSTEQGEHDTTWRSYDDSYSFKLQ